MAHDLPICLPRASDLCPLRKNPLPAGRGFFAIASFEGRRALLNQDMNAPGMGISSNFK
ncbi:MAG: hypothetical protein JGK37_25670 [Microcoleus sp. PH2017_06_SFM_O_A]|nr:hypothetical protein [Microcoleus sp. PH2017_06_SFM_O_A]